MINKKSVFKIIILTFICSFILVVYLVDSSKTLGILKEEINEKESSNSVITLLGKEGEKLKFEYFSSIKEGTLIFQLTDKEGIVIETFESGISSSKVIKLNKDDEYTLSATYEGFIGSYRIEVMR